jgi:hypothetical protein
MTSDSRTVVLVRPDPSLPSVAVVYAPGEGAVLGRPSG